MKPGEPLPRIRDYPLEPEKSEEKPAEKAKAANSKAESRRDEERPEPLRRGTPEPEPKSRRPKKPEASKPATEKKRLLEDETPRLDTYEGRRNIRVGLGSVAAAVFLLSMGWVMLRLFGSKEQPYVDDDVTALSVEPVAGTLAPRPVATSVEREAQVALADARRFAEKGDSELTLRKLNGLVESYPKTRAADEARNALERADQGLPVFVDTELVIAQPTESPEPPPSAAPAPVVVVEETRPPVDNGTSFVKVTPPLTPPEPRRVTNLPTERVDRPPLPLPTGFRPRPEAGVHPTGWPLEITGDLDGATLVFIPGGTFLMGLDEGDATERPAHRVALSPFYIDQHEVTAGQYAIYLKHASAGTPASTAAAPDGSTDPRLPQTGISFTQADQFAAWAGKSLPTEAQWEMAGRTIDGRVNPWGRGQPSWPTERKIGQIDPVMSFELDLSPYGVFDLAGNTREWTADFFRYYPASLVSSVTTDPRVLDAGRSRTPARVIKGGASDWRLPWRRDMSPEARLPDLGLRCVLNLPGVAAPPVAADPDQQPSPAQQPSQPRSLPGGAVPF